MMLKCFLLVICLCFVHAEVSQSEAESFFTWVKEKNNFPSPKFTLSPTTKDDLGFLGQVKPVATADIEEGEVVYSFTPSQSFNYESNEVNPFSDLVDVLHLIHEKQNIDTSSWAPYLKILPSKFTTPIFWTPAEFAELEGTSIYGAIVRLNSTIKTEYEAVIESRNYTSLFPDSLSRFSEKSDNSEKSEKSEKSEDSEVSVDDEEEIDEEDVLTIQEWRWAYNVFRSRNWKTQNGPKIAPVLELFNYGKESNVKVVTNNASVDLVAEVDIAKGETLIINDGLIGNRELLDWYGFVARANSNDYFPVGVGLDDDEKLYGVKRDLFKRRGIKDGQTFHLQYNLIPRDLVFALRVYHLTVYDYSEADNALSDKVVSAQNEMSVVNTLIDLCENTLDNLRHPLKQDKAKLDSPDTTGPLRSAITVRRTEKKIVHSVLKLAKMQQEDVQKLWNTRSFEIPTVRDPNKQ